MSKVLFGIFFFSEMAPFFWEDLYRKKHKVSLNIFHIIMYFAWGAVLSACSCCCDFCWGESAASVRESSAGPDSAVGPASVASVYTNSCATNKTNTIPYHRTIGLSHDSFYGNLWPRYMISHFMTIFVWYGTLTVIRKTIQHKIRNINCICTPTLYLLSNVSWKCFALSLQESH